MPKSSQITFFQVGVQSLPFAENWKRYTKPQLRARFNKEFRFLLLGDLRGKTLLDVGCGDSLNVALLAKMGAEVTGLDVSSGAVALARRRAGELRSTA